MGKKNVDADRKRRIEEARRKQQAAERRRTVLAIGGASVLGIALIATALFWDTGDNPRERRLEELAAIGVSRSEAACGEVEDQDPIPKGGDHEQGRIDWEQVPPDSGPHHASTLRNVKTFYSRDDEPAPEEAVHSLEHGAVVIWYDRKVPDEQVDLLEEAVSKNPSRRTLAVPWLREDFAGDRHIVLTAWGHRQACGEVSGEVIRDFIEEYEDSPDAPERGLQF